MPNSKNQREHLLLKKRLKVSELREFLDEGDLCRKAYDEAKEKWGNTFNRRLTRWRLPHGECSSLIAMVLFEALMVALERTLEKLRANLIGCFKSFSLGVRLKIKN